MNQIQQAIHKKLAELAKQLGHDASRLRPDESIPESGLLDSAALMELIVWYEGEFGLQIEQEQLTVENFGTVDAMTSYVENARR